MLGSDSDTPSPHERDDIPLHEIIKGSLLYRSDDLELMYSAHIGRHSLFKNYPAVYTLLVEVTVYLNKATHT